MTIHTDIDIHCTQIDIRIPLDMSTTMFMLYPARFHYLLTHPMHHHPYHLLFSISFPLGRRIIGIDTTTIITTTIDTILSPLCTPATCSSAQRTPITNPSTGLPLYPMPSSYPSPTSSPQDTTCTIFSVSVPGATFLPCVKTLFAPIVDAAKQHRAWKRLTPSNNWSSSHV